MEEAAQAWQQAVERAPGGKVSGRLLKSVVRSIKKAAPAEARPRPGRANKGEKRKLIQSAIGELPTRIGIASRYPRLQFAQRMTITRQIGQLQRLSVWD